MARIKENKLVTNVNSVIGHCLFTFGFALNEQLMKIADEDIELLKKMQPHFDVIMAKVRAELPLMQAGEDY